MTPPKKLVKMSALAELSGVPAATIKHYLREGLLPRAVLKTSRNTALYDPALAPRIRRIKALQREHFLPLKLIKSVLDGKPSQSDDTIAAAAIERTLASMAAGDRRTRRALLAEGMPEKELSFFESLGLVTPLRDAHADGDSGVSGDDTFAGDDLALLRVLGASRRGGITRAMLPVEILGAYVNAIRELVRVELEMFRNGVLPRAGEDLAGLTDLATRLSEELVVLVRRKMLLPTLERLVEQHAGTRSPSARRSPRPPRARARGASRRGR